MHGAQHMARMNAACPRPAPPARLHACTAPARAPTTTTPTARLHAHPPPPPPPPPAGATKPHHMVTEGGVVLGHCHQGMLTAARGILRQLAPPQGPSLLRRALAQAGSGYGLRVVGGWQGWGRGWGGAGLGVGARGWRVHHACRFSWPSHWMLVPGQCHNVMRSVFSR